LPPRLIEYVAGKGLTLYPAQEEAILELFEDEDVIPGGSETELVLACQIAEAHDGSLLSSLGANRLNPNS